MQPPHDGHCRFPNMAYAVLGNLFLLAHNACPPPDKIWHAYLDEMKRVHAVAEMRTLIFTQGGGPDARQRAAMNEILQGTPTRVAVVTDSVLGQSCAAALQLLNPEVRCFPVARIESAYAYLNVNGPARGRVSRAMMELRARLAPEAPSSSAGLGRSGARRAQDLWPRA